MSRGVPAYQVASLIDSKLILTLSFQRYCFKRINKLLLKARQVQLYKTFHTQSAEQL